MRAALVLAAAALTACSSASAPSHPAAGVAPAPSTATTSAATSAGTSPAAAPSRPPALRVATALRLPTGVSRAVALTDGSRIVVLGGLAPGDSTTDRVLAVDPAAHSARVVGALSTPVHDACGGVIDGRDVVFGGGAATTVSVVQEWQSGSSRAVAHLPEPRSDSSCASVNGTTYVAGGFDGHRMLTDVLATSDGRRFRVVAHLRQGVRYAAVAAVGHWLVVVGGALATTEGTSTGAQSDLVQRVDLDNGHVDVIGHTASPIAHATAVTLGGEVLVVGGRHGTAATAEIASVDPAGGAVRRVARLPRALSDAAIAVVGDTAFVVGGETSGPDAPVDTVTALRLVP